MKYLINLFLVLGASFCWGQTIPPDTACEIDNRSYDSLTISSVEDVKGIDKVLHAEPLYIDLIRDLGARKGEREWNVGVGMRDKGDYVEYEKLIEYEWAPINRLGLEVELPFTYYDGNLSSENGEKRANNLNGLKLAAQYSFYVSEKKATSMALGYIHKFKTGSFREWQSRSNYLSGNLFNPFLVVAKRWGNNWHSLLYTGPSIERSQKGKVERAFEINSNLHYMITGTRNFVGLEINKEYSNRKMEVVFRPQLRVSINDHLIIGIVSSIGASRNNERLGNFVRFIYEPH